MPAEAVRGAPEQRHLADAILHHRQPIQSARGNRTGRPRRSGGRARRDRRRRRRASDRRRSPGLHSPSAARAPAPLDRVHVEAGAIVRAGAARSLLWSVRSSRCGSAPGVGSARARRPRSGPALFRPRLERVIPHLVKDRSGGMLTDRDPGSTSTRGASGLCSPGDGRGASVSRNGPGLPSVVLPPLALRAPSHRARARLAAVAPRPTRPALFDRQQSRTAEPPNGIDPFVSAGAIGSSSTCTMRAALAVRVGPARTRTRPHGGDHIGRCHAGHDPPDRASGAGAPPAARVRLAGTRAYARPRA